MDTKKIVVLDCGMAYELGNIDKNRLLKFLHSIGEINYNATARILVQMGKLNNLTEFQINKIVKDVEQL